MLVYGSKKNQQKNIQRKQTPTPIHRWWGQGQENRENISDNFLFHIFYIRIQRFKFIRVLRQRTSKA